MNAETNVIRARDFMTRQVVTVEPGMPVSELAGLLASKRISGVPVMENERMVGIVTEKDLIDRVKKVHMPTVVTILDAVIPIAGEQQFEEDLRKMTAVTVGEIMSSPVEVVEGDDDISGIATIMSEKGLSLLPVSENGELAGIIGRRDVIRALSESKSI